MKLIELLNESSDSLSYDEISDLYTDREGFFSDEHCYRKDGGSVHGLFFSPHKALELSEASHGTIEDFMADVMKNPQEYCWMQPYTASDARDHFDELVIVRRDGLKDLKFPMSAPSDWDEYYDVEESIERIKSATGLEELPFSNPVEERGGYGLVYEVQGGSLILMIEND